MVKIELALRYIDESHERLSEILSDDVEYIFNGVKTEGKADVLKMIRKNALKFSVDYVTENGCTKLARVHFDNKATGFIEMIADERNDELEIERIQVFVVVWPVSSVIIPKHVIDETSNDFDLGKKVRHGKIF